MKVISVVNQKGGCGKTITALNLSAGLSKKGFRVLLIDLDPQAHATFAMKKETNFTITDILEKIVKNEKIPSDRLYIPISDTLSFIPSCIGLVSLEHKLIAKNDKLQIISSFLNTLESSFDYVVIDCPPNLGILTLNALDASTYSLIPMGICNFSLKGVEMLKNILIMLKEFKGTAPAPFYLLNQIDMRSNFSRTFVEKVKSQLGNLLLKTVIRNNIHLREAISYGKNIFDYKPDCHGSEDFTALTDEIAQTTFHMNWTPLFLKSNHFREVHAVGDFSNWQKDDRYRMKKIGHDIWALNVNLERGKYHYKFLAENDWLTDPHNKTTESDCFGGKNSVLCVK